MKKILLGIAAVTTVTAPLATVYVMNPNENPPITVDDSISPVDPVETTSLEVIKSVLDNYTNLNSHFTFDQFNSIDQSKNLLIDLSLVGINSDIINDAYKLFGNSDITYDGYTLTDDPVPNTLELLFNNKTDKIIINDISFKNKEDVDTSVVATTISKLENTKLIGDVHALGSYDSIEDLESVYSFTGEVFKELKSIFALPLYSLNSVVVSSNNTTFNYTISNNTSNIFLSSTIVSDSISISDIVQEIQSTSPLNPSFAPLSKTNAELVYTSDNFSDFDNRFDFHDMDTSFIDSFDPVNETFKNFSIPFTVNHQPTSTQSLNWVEYTLPDNVTGRIEFQLWFPY